MVRNAMMITQRARGIAAVGLDSYQSLVGLKQAKESCTNEAREIVQRANDSSALCPGYQNGFSASSRKFDGCLLNSAMSALGLGGTAMGARAVFKARVVRFRPSNQPDIVEEYDILQNLQYVRRESDLGRLAPGYISNTREAQQQFSRNFESALRTDVPNYDQWVLAQRERHKLATGETSGRTYEFNGYQSNDPKIVGPGRFRNEIHAPDDFIEYGAIVSSSQIDEFDSFMASRGLQNADNESIVVLGLEDKVNKKANVNGVRDLRFPRNYRFPTRSDGVAHIYPDHAATQIYLGLTYERYQDVVSAVRAFNANSSAANLNKSLEALSDYYHTAINGHLHGRVNNSILMGEVNTVLKNLGLKPVAHGQTDIAAISMDYQVFRQYFLNFVRPAVKPAAH
jgi:hypothetical protein